MSRRKALATLLVLVLLSAIVACAPAPTPVPTAAPPTVAPQATAVPKPTEAPKATSAPAQPTAAPAQPTAAPKPTEAAANMSMFKGKTINLIVPHGAGGGYDTYARMVAPYLEKELGATIVVENVTGAGGDVGRNKVWNAKPDGLNIGFTSGSAMVYSQLSKSESAQYDVAKITWMARALAEPSVLVLTAKSPYQSIADLQKATKPIKFAVSGVGDDDFFGLGIEGRALGIKFLPVTGYNGTKEASLAVVTGEVDAFQTSIGTMLPLIKKGDVKPIMIVLDEKHSSLPDVPTYASFATGDNAKLAQAQIGIAKITRVFFGPPNMSPEIVNVFETAFNKILNDKDFLDKATKAERPILYAPGSEVTKMVTAAVQQGAAVTPILKEALKAAQ